MVLATVGPDVNPQRGSSVKEIVPQPGPHVLYELSFTQVANSASTREQRWSCTGTLWHRQVRSKARCKGPKRIAMLFRFPPGRAASVPGLARKASLLASRKELQASVAQDGSRFGTPQPDAQPYCHGLHRSRPPHWGGYYLWAESVELWVEGEARIHDRARWTRRLSLRTDNGGDDLLRRGTLDFDPPEALT